MKCVGARQDGLPCVTQCNFCKDNQIMNPIDWTKPIKHLSLRNGTCTFIVKDGDWNVVKFTYESGAVVYAAYDNEGFSHTVSKHKCIENVPEETVIYVYRHRYRDDAITSWCLPNYVDTIKKDYKNCLLSMQKVTLKDGDIYDGPT